MGVACDALRSLLYKDTIRVLHRPKLHSEYRFIPVNANTAILISEREERVLRGGIYVALLPYLEGSFTPAEIAKQLKQRYPRENIYYALTRLEKEGCLQEANQPAPSPLKIQIQEIGATPLDWLSVALVQSGATLDPNASLRLVATDDYLQPELEEINRTTLHSGVPWLLVRPLGKTLWLGPLFVPNKTACWECLAERLRSTQVTQGFLQNLAEEGRPVVPPLESNASSRLLIASILVEHLQEWEHGRLENRILTLNPKKITLEEHLLQRRPQCRVCGSHSLAKGNADFALKSRGKQHTSDGGHNSCNPEATFLRYQHHISPLTGAVPSLSPVKGLDETLHVYLAGVNFAAPKRNDFALLRATLRSASMGKGVTEIQAKVSALCEALERYCCRYEGDSSAVRASLEAMGERAIDPRSILLFSEKQYALREEVNARSDSWNYVPEPFDPQEQIEWTPVRSLIHGTKSYVATAQCWFGYPFDLQRRFVQACSNGCASGNTLEEAIFQGMMELVERDSVALWWYNRLSVPALNLESFALPYLDQVQKAHRDRYQRALWVLDVTSDTEIPTFVAVSTKQGREVPEPVFGFGAHRDPQIALLRAVTELNQMLSIVETANRGEHDSHLRRFLEGTIWEQLQFLKPNTSVPTRTKAHFDYTPSDDILEDVRLCADHLYALGMETFALDMTRPDIGLPVVRVIVPGLRHFWRRLAPGRLYTVPVKRGLLAQCPTEEELNPLPILM